MNKKIITILILLLPLGVFGATYYVSNTGDDDNTGLSTDQAWQTMTKVSSVSFSPGDSVLFKRGDTFTDFPIYMAADGSAGSPITISAYGTGNNPIFDASDNGYGTAAFIDKDNITLSDLTLINGSSTAVYGSGLYITTATNTTVSNLVVKDNLNVGIGGIVVDNLKISNCSIHDNDRQGIYLAYPTNSLVERNEVYHNSLQKDDAFGIDIIVPTGPNVVRYNTVHDQEIITNPALYVCGGSKCGNGGIRFDGDGTGSNNTSMPGNEAYRNVIYDEDQGIQFVNFSGAWAYNNTIYNTRMYGAIMMAQPGYGVSTGNIFTNNIVQASTSQTIIASLNNPTSTVNYNLYYPIDSQFIWTDDVNWTPAGLSKTNFATWKTNSGYDANSINNTPGFINISKLDLDLLSTSNAINAGTTSTSTVDIVGHAINGLWDIGAFEYRPSNSNFILKGNAVFNGNVQIQ